MRKFILFSLSLLTLVSQGLAQSIELTLTNDKSVTPSLVKMMQALGYQGNEDLVELNTYAQQNLLRSAKVERWNVHDEPTVNKHRKIILKTIKDLGFFEEVSPDTNLTYENVLILGASVARMRSRVAFFQDLTSKGLQYKNIYFLTGERPLDPKIEDETSLYTPGANKTFRKEWIKPDKAPRTESAGARLVWEQLIGDAIKPPIYVDVPMKKEGRPSTVDTINAWLNKKPTMGRTLIVSNNPYIPYQHAVVLGALIDKGFMKPQDIQFFKTVGPSTKPENERLRVLLDNIARTLYGEKKLWDSVSKLNAQNKAEKKSVQVLVDVNFRGDENQVLGIRDALLSLDKHMLEFSIYPYESFTFEKNTPQMLLLSGSSGLSFLRASGKHIPKGTAVVWSGHQVFPELSSVAERITLTFLPAHAVSEKDQRVLGQKTKLALLEGVPHRIMKSSLSKTRQEFESKNGALPKPQLEDLLGIVLPGDAPDKQGEMLYFTPEHAKKLAKNIVAIEGPNKHYLVTNGPRTGSHDYISKKKLDPSRHRSQKVDEVTSAFMDELTKLGVKKMQLFDFQFSKLPSVYQALLSLAADGMRLHIPGESTSMVTESTDVASNIVIDLVPSMNQDHFKHLDVVRKREAAQILTWEGKSKGSDKVKKQAGVKQTPAEIAAKIISRQLIELPRSP